MSLEPFTKGLALTLHLGAAVHDSTPEQRALLERRVMPLLRGKYLETGDESEVRSAVSDIMGADWSPSDEWRLQA